MILESKHVARAVHLSGEQTGLNGSRANFHLNSEVDFICINSTALMLKVQELDKS